MQYFEEDNPGCFEDDGSTLKRMNRGVLNMVVFYFGEYFLGVMKRMVQHFEEDDHGCFEEDGVVL